MPTRRRTARWGFQAYWVKTLTASMLGLSCWASTALAEHQDIQLLNARSLSPEETLLINALHNWEDGNPSLAVTTLDSLLQLAPKFTVAQSLQKAIQQQPLLGDEGIYQTFMAQPLSRSVKSEFQQRWDYFLNPADSSKVPASLIKLSDSQKHAVAVDLSRNRIYLFENKNGHPRMVSDLYAGIGSEGFGKQLRGDKKTPIGLYFVTSQMADNELDELYGIGAFPLSYPNALDRNRGRTGSGIWIHGVPRSTWTRAPLSSRGCVTIANQDFERLNGRVIANQTPVLLSNELNWVTPDAQANDEKTLLNALTDWADDWQSLNTDDYLAHYSEDFIGQEMDFAQWREHKQRVNKRKQWIKLELDDISVFKDPNEAIMIVTFMQDYRSDNFSSQDYKRQYWQKQPNGDWKILFENGV